MTFKLLPTTDRWRCRLALAVSLALAWPAYAVPTAEDITLFHVGDQESWLISAQGNLYDAPSDALSYYGGAARLATLMQNERSEALAAGRSVLAVNAGDAFLPGPRLTASFANLANAAPGGGQDFYDAIVLRQLGFDSVTFGNHEFDLGSSVTAQFVAAANTPYLSANLDFSGNAALQALVDQQKIAPSLIVETSKGNKIAIVGATTPLLPTISSPDGVSVKNLDPAADADSNLLAMVPLLQAQIDQARADGATAVVLVSHLQNYQNELKLVPKLSGLDVFVSGGGHELMSDPGEPTIRGELPVIDGYPQVVTLDDGSKVLGVTSNFGNRYLGELNLSLDDQGRVVRDAAGVPVVGDGSGMLRVSGNPADPDFVAPDPVIDAQVVTPVREYIAALNQQIIGHSDMVLDGTRGSAPTAAAAIQFGVRNSETNLGDLVADAVRFTAKTDIAIQNGGGIRASINAGDVSVGDTFNVLPFTNLVVQLKDLSAEQVWKLMEYSLATASPDGAANGRFAQVSGMSIVYDTRRDALVLDADGNAVSGGRILSITLDDGTRLVENGVVNASARRVSLGTIDFTANGGDGYPFALLGLKPEALVDTLLYQEALLNYITAATADGGLGGVISADRYGVANPYDREGRLVDLAVAVPAPSALWLLPFGLLAGYVGRRRAA